MSSLPIRNLQNLYYDFIIFLKVTSFLSVLCWRQQVLLKRQYSMRISSFTCPLARRSRCQQWCVKVLSIKIITVVTWTTLSLKTLYILESISCVMHNILQNELHFWAWLTSVKIRHGWGLCRRCQYAELFRCIGNMVRWTWLRYEGTHRCRQSAISWFKVYFKVCNRPL
jgi:hypothetical protein